MTRTILLRSICPLIVGAALMVGCVSPLTTTSQPTLNIPHQATQPPTTLVPSNTNEPVPTASGTPIPIPTSTNLPTSTSTPEVVLTNTSAPSETTAPIGNLIVHYFDVGQGDSILVQAPGGEAGLIDGGEPNTGIVQYLRGLGVKHLNFVLATHPHSDHIGGLVQVLQVIPVDIVYTNGVPYTTLTYEHFLDAISISKAKYLEAKRGDSIQLGNLTFFVLSPINNTDEDINNGSIVLRLVYGKVSFLFTGDAQVAAEDSMLSAGLDVSATILKVGHHGSRTASSPAFLAKVKPEIAIYMAGKGNDYGHPHPETIAALKAVGAKIYGTDVNGTIIVTTDGNGYSIETAKQGQAQAPPVIVPTSQSSNPVIDIVSLTSPIPPGGMASLTINTAPGATCTIKVYYKSGASQAAGLGPQTADASGNVTWSWKVGSKTTPGTWRIVVTANINGQTITKEITFVVQK